MLHLRPNVLKVPDGMIRSHPTPRGYATSCTTTDVTVSVGDRRLNKAFSPDAIVVKRIPIAHARMVLHGRSSS